MVSSDFIAGYFVRSSVIIMISFDYQNFVFEKATGFFKSLACP